MNNPSTNPRFTQNRELSWLKFNERVLDEASDHTIPLLERLKFISIFMTNLDEFFMIRVGSLMDLMAINEDAIDNKTGMTVQSQIESIYNEVEKLNEKKDRIFLDLEKNLHNHGIFNLTKKDLTGSELKFIKSHFKNNIAPILSPQIVDSHHPFPHVPNKILYIGALLKKNNMEFFALIPVPTSLPEIVLLPDEGTRFISVEKIILDQVENIFQMYTVVEKVCFCVTRNADISTQFEELDFDIHIDFRRKMKKLLNQRKKMSVVRIELSGKISNNFKKYFLDKFSIQESQIFISKAPMTMKYAYSIDQQVSPNLIPYLTYRKFIPEPSHYIHNDQSIINQVYKNDLLLSYPYESMDPFLRLVKEAAHDPATISIKITIYRLSSRAKLVDYLSYAAENGKEVTVLIELRARFDEQNNIDWSERLEESGCTLIYGFSEYKVHSKICLITRMEKNEIVFITQIGTGNYNEKTAEIYTDLSLITAHPGIAADAMKFFQNMSIGNIFDDYTHLMVAPQSMKKKIIELIDEEIEKKEQGNIIIKINSITDLDIINKLAEASSYGVQIHLIVRGICCILPGVSGKTETIHVTSIVGRFLEHSRIYYFGKPGSERIYISSADFMTRNLERRVEVACPVYQDDIKKRIYHILSILMRDNVKASELRSDGSYMKIYDQGKPFSSQEYFMTEAKNTPIISTPTHKNKNFLNRFKDILGIKKKQ